MQDLESIEQLDAQPQLAKNTAVADDIQDVENSKESRKDVAENILALMKLYPQYKEFYVTPKGFVHPTGVPEYLCKGATLYKNKFFNK